LSHRSTDDYDAAPTDDFNPQDPQVQENGRYFVLIDLPSILMAIAGGVMIGLAASAMLFFVGRIAGISGIVGGLLRPEPDDSSWRLAFLGGLFVGGLLLAATLPEAIGSPSGRSLPALGLAGLLVGFGVRMASGCTSGHGVCGLSRLSVRSLVATLTFMAVGFATATSIELLAGGTL